MGREYWHWRRKEVQVDQKVERGRRRRRRRRGEGKLEEEEEEEETRGRGGGLASSCMCAVFQLFDNFQLAPSSSSSMAPFKPASFLVEDHLFHIPKGSEAPRNSLELEEPSFPISTGKENKTNLEIPMSIQIKTRKTMGDHKRSTSKALKGGQPDSETLTNADSPSTKTPTLVARLMGLDLLPDPSSSPSSPSSASRPHLRSAQRVSALVRTKRTRDVLSGTRSLPETPRVSTSSSRRSDVDHHHRLSLQTNKENVFPSILTRRDQNLVEGKCTSPGNYARQIVKQVKESVSRRVGLDITNNVSDSRKKAAGSKSVHHQAPRVATIDAEKRGELSSLSAAPSSRRLHVQRGTADVIRKKKEETFVRPSTRSNGGNNQEKKPKRRMMMIMPLSSNLAPPNGFLPVKRDPTPPATKIPPKQAPNGQEPKWSSQLSRCSSQPYKFQETTSVYTTRMYNNRSNARLNTNTNDKFKFNNSTSVAPVSVATIVVTENGAAEYDYIARVLKRTGVDQDSSISSNRWFSPAHPLDPSIFYYLEHFTDVATEHPGQLSQRCNRKLLFQLVDEILVDILRPHSNSNQWVGPSFTIGCLPEPAQMKGFDLVGLLCTTVRSFPAVDCRVLEDIDGLIEKDMIAPLVGPMEPGFKEEEGGLVGQVERDILDTLVQEVAVVLCGVGRGGEEVTCWWT